MKYVVPHLYHTVIVNHGEQAKRSEQRAPSAHAAGLLSVATPLYNRWSLEGVTEGLQSIGWSVARTYTLYWMLVSTQCSVITRDIRQDLTEAGVRPSLRSQHAIRPFGLCTGLLRPIRSAPVL
jgi:hypothetical protein